MTHEEFLAAIRDTVAARLSPDLADVLHHVKLVYGVGVTGTRGRTLFHAWQNGQPQRVDVIEICAISEESPIQLAGTTIHELAHVIAGPKSGHNRAWKDTCLHLGLANALAAGQTYQATDFAPDVRAVVDNVTLADGHPAIAGAVASKGPRPCVAGIGTRGGKSRGPGSGSRLRKWSCPCGVNVRVASDDFRATCQRCTGAFMLAGGTP